MNGSTGFTSAVPRDFPRSDGPGPTSADILGHECQRAQTARRAISARRIRNAAFSPIILGDPAWDLLLDLYVRETSGESSTAAHVILATGCPSSTASRWLDCLDRLGAIRRAYRVGVGSELVQLTAWGRSGIEDYLDALGGL